MKNKLGFRLPLIGLTCACLMQSMAVSAAAQLPDPKTAGKNGGPVAILFLSPQPQMDPQYAKELSAAGFSFALCDYYEALTPEFIRTFNVVVIDKFPFANAENQLFGQRMIPFRQNLEQVWRFAADGGGVLVYPNLTDCGGNLCGGWNQEMSRWGVRMLQMCVRDPATAFNKFRVYGDNYYCWTENLMKHPVTEGLRRMYYPSVNGRWDDCYSTPPVVCDSNWTVLVKGMASATVITEVDKVEIQENEHKNDTTMAAVRTVGKGRMGVMSINPTFTHQLGYTLNGKNSECNYGPIDGMILKKGDGQVASDTGAMLRNLYAWLASDSIPAGLGGYKTGDPIGKAPVTVSDDIKTFQPQFDVDNLKMPPSWRHRPELAKVDGNYYVVEIADTSVTGEVKFLKALVGAHSQASDGKGTVAEYATAAKKAGYAMVAFTENFERLTPAKWDTLLQDCRANTTDDFVCLPGIDIQDPAGNHFILAGIDRLPRPSWLTADGKRLAMTANINLLLSGHTVIAHRPLAGPLPFERIKHFQALTVFTYRDGKLVEDATKPYVWQIINGSSPHPVVVHEVFSPGEVAAAMKTGYQQIMPSDTAAHAAGYFCAGMGAYYDAPSRHILSEGPEVYDFTVNLKDVGPAEMNREQFRVAVGVRSESPLKTVTLYDGFEVVRRWLPQGKEFHATADFRHTHQQGLFLVAEDASGKRALTSCIRNVARRYHTRCTDRQNWLGDPGFVYTGTYLPPRMGTTSIMMPIKGTKEASTLFPDVAGANMAVKLNFPFTCNDIVLTEAAINEKYTIALWDTPPYRVGFDATPSQASEPSTVYDAKFRYFNFTSGRKTRPVVSLVELEVTLKRDVEPLDPAAPFPAFGGLSFGTNWAWMADGKLVTGVVSNESDMHIPVGGMAGGYVALSKGLIMRKGLFGMEPPAGNPATLKAGTRYTARYLIPTAPNNQDSTPYTFDDRTEPWMTAMGLAGPTPYKLKFTRGKLEGTTYFATVTPDKQGVAGDVVTTAEIPFDVPLRLNGLNARWPAGSWRENGVVVFTGVFESTAWPRLDVSQKGKFYAGNLLVADNPDLVLAVVRWNKDAIKIDAHNPTATSITATISTPVEISGYKSFKKKVTIPAGSSVMLD
jgi:hypothetical protein